MPDTKEIGFPPALKAWVRQQVARRGFADEAEYIRDLVRREKERHRELSSLEATLLDALDSGAPTPMTDADWKMIEKQGLSRLARKRK